MPERLVNGVLGASVGIFEFAETPIGNVIGVLASRTSEHGVSIVLSRSIDPVDFKVSVAAKDLSVHALLVMLADQSGGEICFIAREYGFLVVPRAEAESIPGPAIPAEVPYRAQRSTR